MSTASAQSILSDLINKTSNSVENVATTIDLFMSDILNTTQDDNMTDIVSQIPISSMSTTSSSSIVEKSIIGVLTTFFVTLVQYSYY
jgi:hypothetical protein